MLYLITDPDFIKIETPIRESCEGGGIWARLVVSEQPGAQLFLAIQSSYRDRLYRYWMNHWHRVLNQDDGTEITPQNVISLEQKGKIRLLCGSPVEAMECEAVMAELVKKMGI